MVTIIVNELEGFKEKLQQAIDHVKAGVSHLNEDQRAEAMVKLADLEEHLDRSLDKCFEVLRPDEGVRLIDLKPEDPPASTAGQPVPEPLKSVVDESGAEVVLLPSIWHQRNSAGKEVEVHVESPGVIAAEPAKE